MLFILFGPAGYTQLPLAVDEVRMVNTGKMYIGGTDANDVSLYIPSAVKMAGNNVGIMQNGKTVVTGNFYQDGTGNVFDTGSNGTFCFRNDTEPQFITCSSSLMAALDRGTSYVAFPRLEIEKNTRLTVVPKMGIDAIDIIRPATKTGVLYLQSAPEDNTDDSPIYDASLRVTGNNQVEAGLVVVERYVEGYRGSNWADCILFPFATPFVSTQRAGYFAGNWLRTPLMDGEYNSAPYPMADRPNENGTIREDQYITPADDILTPGIPYYLRLRPRGQYDDLPFIITTGDPGEYEKETFVFDGTVYSLPEVKEQLFTGNTLFTGSVSPAATPASTLNWVIGNSYTSPLSIPKIIEKMGASTLMFSPILYVFYAGQTTLLPISAEHPTTGVPNLLQEEHVPSMGVFMIRVSKNSSQNGTFTIGREEQEHAKVSHNLKNASVPFPDVLFKLYPVSQPRLKDLAVIGLRENTSLDFGHLDMEKAYNHASEVFQLYTLSQDDVKLSANAIPFQDAQIPLCVYIGKGEGIFRLVADRLETIDQNHEVWLEDLWTKDKINLKEVNTYEFQASEEMDAHRFMVHFKLDHTKTEGPSQQQLKAYYVDGQIVISGLSVQDLGATVQLIDTKGTIIEQIRINDYPVMRYPVDFPQGIYMGRMIGYNSFVFKLKL